MPSEASKATSAASGVEDHRRILVSSNLHVHFYTYAGTVKALNGFELSVRRGEMSALVGESGSGKSVAAWSLLGLPKRPGKIVEGEVLWHNENVLDMSPDRLRHLRGQEISLILSNPKAYLHPLVKVGKQVQAVYRAHHKVSRAQARDAILAMLKAIGLPDVKRIFDAYPHELSGGMAQRIVIAISLINSPKLVIADDATNGLDVTIQRQVLDLMSDLIRQQHASALVITHDLGIVAQYCKWATIIYAGQTIEVAAVERLFQNPLHPYTQGLRGSIRATGVTARRDSLSGMAPDPLSLPPGCYFEPRCPVRRAECKHLMPALREVESEHWVRCNLCTDSWELQTAEVDQKLAKATSYGTREDFGQDGCPAGQPLPD